MMTRANRGRTIGSRLTGGFLAIAATAGGLCMVWFIAAPLLHLSIVVVTTGSMSPSLPAGGAAVVQTVAASELAPGEVVTVPRPESRLPVTHRIVSIDSVPGTPDARSLTLRGDANDTNDRAPYVVADVRRVIVGVPLAGFAVLLVQSPIVMGLMTLVVGALVVWAFWPRQKISLPSRGTTAEAQAEPARIEPVDRGS